jgi:hypothetical protein
MQHIPKLGSRKHLPNKSDPSSTGCSRVLVPGYKMAWLSEETVTVHDGYVGAN